MSGAHLGLLATAAGGADGSPPGVPGPDEGLGARVVEVEGRDDALVEGLARPA